MVWYTVLICCEVLPEHLWVFTPFAVTQECFLLLAIVPGPPAAPAHWCTIAKLTTSKSQVLLVAILVNSSTSAYSNFVSTIGKQQELDEREQLQLRK